MIWTFSLVTLFVHAFPIGLQDIILKVGYTLQNLSLLTTKSLQDTTLPKLEGTSSSYTKKPRRRIKNNQKTTLISFTFSFAF